jgi:tripartite-type tricarboxylate transporter receptor subunit TctC
MRGVTRAAGLTWVAIIGTMLPPAASAQPYPSQLIKIIVPFSAGGPVDALARPLAQKLTESLGQAVVVENRPGANGIIGANAVAKAAPDGYMLLLTTGAHTAIPAIAAKVPYATIEDFAPVTQLAVNYGLLLTAPAKFPAQTVADLVTVAKASPGKLSYGITGNGNITHISMELFKTLAGIDALTVPFKGTAEVVTAQIGGQVDLAMHGVAPATPYLVSGQLRALALTGGKRAPTLPAIPTFQELGYADIDLTGWYGLWAPAGTPPERVALLREHAKRALATPELQRYLNEGSIEPVASTPEEFGAFLVKDVAYQASVMRRIGIHPR